MEFTDLVHASWNGSSKLTEFVRSQAAVFSVRGI